MRDPPELPITVHAGVEGCWASSASVLFSSEWFQPPCGKFRASGERGDAYLGKPPKSPKAWSPDSHAPRGKQKITAVL